MKRSDKMVSFKEIIAQNAEKHKLENAIPDDYECVKITDIVGKEFKVDMFNLYVDKKQDEPQNKVVLGITTVDGQKYRIHTGASRIVEIFTEIQNFNADENNAEKIDITEGTHVIKSLNLNQGVMFIFE